MMNKKIIAEIESLEPRLIRIYEAYLDINPDTVSIDPLKVERALNLKERWALKKERYQEKDGWQFCGHAYVLKNTCPICGQPLYISHQTSPGYTWRELCGREGYLLYCPHCKKDINFFLTVMN